MADQHLTVEIDNSSPEALRRAWQIAPGIQRRKLSSQAQVNAEMRRVYHRMKAGTIESLVAGRMIAVLREISRQIELEAAEKRELLRSAAGPDASDASRLPAVDEWVKQFASQPALPDDAGPRADGSLLPVPVSAEA